MASISITRAVQRDYTRVVVIYGTLTADLGAAANTINHVRFRTSTGSWVTVAVDTGDADYTLPATGSGAFQLPVTLPMTQSRNVTFDVSIDSSAPFGGHATMTDGMLFCYECDDNAANPTVTDAHTTAEDGTLRVAAGPWIDLNTSTRSIAGKLDEALDLSGLVNTEAVDFTAVEGGAQGSVYHKDRSFSFAMWYNHNSLVALNANRVLMSNFIGAGWYLAIQFYNIAGNDWRLAFESFDGIWRFVHTTTDIFAMDDTWRHVAVSYDHTLGPGTQDRMKIYFGGADETNLGGNAGLAGGLDNTTWMFGCRPDQNFNGNIKMDQSISWSRVVTPAEVTALYNAGNGLRYSD